ncbi:hypothetical protein KA016_02865 [Candidatus Saccharibacteria bacterium]|nr:hypothetical protein [Candidatus Saccharibacteria bacterium]
MRTNAARRKRVAEVAQMVLDGLADEGQVAEFPMPAFTDPDKHVRLSSPDVEDIITASRVADSLAEMGVGIMVCKKPITGVDNSAPVSEETVVLAIKKPDASPELFERIASTASRIVFNSFNNN